MNAQPANNQTFIVPPTPMFGLGHAADDSSKKKQLKTINMMNGLLEGNSQMQRSSQAKENHRG
jgi:hypothetical protein